MAINGLPPIPVTGIGETRAATPLKAPAATGEGKFANVLQEQGRDKLSALREAAATRLRPVLMTTAATIFGHLPLVFVAGPGAAARNSIGIVLVAGMAIGTVFTLFVVPVFYLWIAADRSQEHGAMEADGVPPGAIDLGHTTPELA